MNITDVKYLEKALKMQKKIYWKKEGIKFYQKHIKILQEIKNNIYQACEKVKCQKHTLCSENTFYSWTSFKIDEKVVKSSIWSQDT